MLPPTSVIAAARDNVPSLANHQNTPSPPSKQAQHVLGFVPLDPPPSPPPCVLATAGITCSALANHANRPSPSRSKKTTQDQDSFSSLRSPIFDPISLNHAAHPASLLAATARFPNYRDNVLTLANHTRHTHSPIQRPKTGDQDILLLRCHGATPPLFFLSSPPPCVLTTPVITCSLGNSLGNHQNHTITITISSHKNNRSR